MCSICLPQSGQAPASHVSQQLTRYYPDQLPAFGPCKQIPSFTMSISKTPAQYKAAKLLSEVSTGKSRNTTLVEWWSQTGSNRRPEACKATALPTELWPRLTHMIRSDPLGTGSNLVGLGRLELPTSRLSSARSNQLSYKPGTGGYPGTKTTRTVLRPREKEKRRRRCSANGPVTSGPMIQ